MRREIARWRTTAPATPASPCWTGSATIRSEWIRLDVIAGLTAAAVVIPKAMAYATIAGLPVQVGLYTALVPMVIYALARHVAAAQREHDDDDRDPDGGGARRGGSGRRPGVAR